MVWVVANYQPASNQRGEGGGGVVVASNQRVVAS